MTESNVFVYGTLQEPRILTAIVGRCLAPAAAVLEDHARYRLSNKVYPAIVEQPGASVSGVLYSGVSASELARLDDYEGPLYERREVWVALADGRVRAHTYVLREQQRHLLAPEPWDLEQFRREHLASYLACISETARAP